MLKCIIVVILCNIKIIHTRIGENMTKSDKIFAFLDESTRIPLKLEEIAVMLDVPHCDMDEFAATLESLVAQGLVIQSKKGRYSSAARMNLHKGRFMSGKNGGFVRPDGDDTGDIVIRPDNTMCAMHDDTVLIRVDSEAANGRKREGTVVRIVTRANVNVVGQVHRDSSRCIMTPANSRLNMEVILAKDGSADVKDGDMVLAEIVRYPTSGCMIKAKVVEIIGAKDHPATDTSCIIYQYGIPHEFSQNAMEQAESTPQAVSADDIKDRADFRALNTFTIDGEDARDLDDAVHIEMLPGGIYRLGVHIADVSHYVQENSAIDIDAFDRATSVYFPDRVVPMLPTALSNGICSLNPNVDRLAFSILMDIAPSGEVVHYELHKSVIHSKARMTYTDVTAIIEEDAPDESEGNVSSLKAKYAFILNDIANMAALAKILRGRRTARGAIDFDFPETKVIIGEDGKVADIVPYKIGVSNHIIEEFMLIANETAAQFAVENELPFVYRTHEAPSADKVTELAKFLQLFNITLDHDTAITPKQMQNVLDRIDDISYKPIISNVMLRSMTKAQYSPQNLGHFGLAAEFYCHFTSPIRRYPDLTIHRILGELLNKKLGTKRNAQLLDFTQRAAKQSTDMEIRATEAERDADKLKICEYMQRFVGEDFDATIVSIAEFGMFVSLDNTAEGLISIRALTDDYYNVNKDLYQLCGERTGKVYSLGDTIRVRLVSSNPHMRQIDFVPTEMADSVSSSFKQRKPHTPPDAHAKKSPLRSGAHGRKNRKAKGDFRKFAKKHGGKKKKG